MMRNDCHNIDITPIIKEPIALPFVPVFLT